jgi:hypothetical protein
MNIRKRAVLAACSDPLSEERLHEVLILKDQLCKEGLETEMIEGFFDSIWFQVSFPKMFLLQKPVI